MKEGQHVNFGPIQAIFLELSWSQPKLAHSSHGRGQRSNGAINRNKHFFRSFERERSAKQNVSPHSGGYVNTVQ